jgi:hypothetical protein
VVVGVLLGTVVLFLCGVLTGWALAHKASAPLSRDYSPAPVPSAASVAQAIADRASRAEVRALEERIEADSRRLGQLQEQIDARPEPPPAAPAPAPAPAPDLAPLRARVDALAKASERLGPLPDELKTAGARVEALEKGMESLRADISSLRQAVERAGAATERTGELAAADHALALGSALFKGGHFAQARDILVKQAAATPDDARLWYSAALANGLATNDWQGESERLVRHGVDREKAGTPPKVEIDALFSGIGEQQGGRWLREWRQHAAGK